MSIENQKGLLHMEPLKLGFLLKEETISLREKTKERNTKDLLHQGLRRLQRRVFRDTLKWIQLHFGFWAKDIISLQFH